MSAAQTNLSDVLLLDCRRIGCNRRKFNTLTYAMKNKKLRCLSKVIFACMVELKVSSKDIGQKKRLNTQS